MNQASKFSSLGKFFKAFAAKGKSGAKALPRRDKHADALYPSGSAPDHIVLTPARDPGGMQTINWRTSIMVTTGQVQYRVKDTNSWQVANARYKTLTAPELHNDRVTHHFYVTLIGLMPGAVYEYRVGYANYWSQIYTFSTAPQTDTPFSFVYLGDVQAGYESVRQAFSAFDRRHPYTSFYLMAGDFVANSEYRNDWDRFMAGTANVFCRKMFAPALGNCDYGRSTAKLPEIYADYFELPPNGVATLPPGCTYSFGYGGAFFIVLDTNQPEEKQTRWLEDTLRQAAAKGYTWQIILMHNLGMSSRSKAPKQTLHAQWLPLFDEYGVDLVLSGHIHSYMRTRPVYKGQVAETGTVYVAANLGEILYKSPETELADCLLDEAQTWQVIEIGRTATGKHSLRYRAYNFAGLTVDEFKLEK